MRKDLLAYLWECSLFTAKSLLKGLDNKIATAIGFVVSVPLGIWPGSGDSLMDALKDQVTSITSWLVVLGAFVFIRFIIIAPFLLYRRQKREIESLKTEHCEEIECLTESHRGEILRKQSETEKLQAVLATYASPPVPQIVPFQDAVAYILNEAAEGKGKRASQIITRLIELGIDSAIPFYGRRKLTYDRVASKRPEVIRPEFLGKCQYRDNYGDQGDPALIDDKGLGLPEAQDPDSAVSLNLKSLQPDVYYNPYVDIEAVKRHFN